MQGTESSGALTELPMAAPGERCRRGFGQNPFRVYGGLKARGNYNNLRVGAYAYDVLRN